MDARGLVAFIITVHELALVLAALIGVLVALVSALLSRSVLREVSSGKRALVVGGLAIGAALIAFAVTARLFHVSALDIDVVRVED